MYKVYILYSVIRDRFYVGFTADDMSERVRRHNSNHAGFTGKTGDWKLVHSEIYDNKEAAMKGEKEIKAWKSRKRVEKLIAPAG